MKPKATIEKMRGLPFYRAFIGDTFYAEYLLKETARHLAAAWNACRDIPTERLEELATAKNLVENEKT